MDLDTWACPVCLSRLSESDAGIACSSEGRRFPRRDGLPVLLRPEEEGLLRDAEGYAAAMEISESRKAVKPFAFRDPRRSASLRGAADAGPSP